MAIPEVSNRGQLSGPVSRELDQHAQQSVSPPTMVAYARQFYTASGLMQWIVREGDQREFWVIERQPTELLVNVNINGPTIAGTVSNILYIRLPFGKVAAHRSDTAGFGFDNALATPIFAFTQAGDSRIAIVRSDLANWTAGGMACAFQLTVWTVAQR